MTFNLVCEVEPDFSFPYEELAQEVIGACMEVEDFPYEAEINLTLVDDPSIREINASYRNIDRATDVLSFPLLEYGEPGDFSNVEDLMEDNINPDTGEVMLGDIVISVDHVREQAKEYGHSEKREYAFLIVHSMLHLFGYDHMEPEEAEEMQEHQRKILDYLQITR